jgi:thiol-disulfide isomerase/thioredoxin
VVILCMCGREVAHSAEQAAQGGIGVAIRIHKGKVLVGSVLPDTSAGRTNAIHPNDRIMAIAEGNKEPVEVTGMDMAKVVGLIRGPQGTVVRLTVVPAGKEEADALVVSMTRGEVQLLDVFGDGKLLPPGAKTPEVKYSRLSDGKKGELSQYQGKIVVLEVWASWCKPCVENLERLETLKREHPEWNGQVEFLAVSADDRLEDATRVCKAKQWAGVTALWTGPSILKALHLSGLPGLYIIDRQGEVAASQPADITAVLKRLLAGDGK